MQKDQPFDSLEQYFSQFRKHIIGIDQSFETPFGQKKIVYFDWTASGRLYRPIEEKMLNIFGPYVANTHTETTVSGTTMTQAYHKARKIIKNHVNAHNTDVFLPVGSGMTGAINKFQRILGLKIPEHLSRYATIPEGERPVVFVTHMEHHSNQTSWLETIARVEVIPAGADGLFSLENLTVLLEKYKDTPQKIASITACSNVTGITTPYHEIAKLMHRYNGLCFVDFACSAPYVTINMHPEEPDEKLDAIFFSPHKFLGGPGTSGVLIFDEKLYKNSVPDNPGGGTVVWTTPWGDHRFLDNIEDREDGGTPGFLQVIKTALAVRLKEKMGVDKMLKREEELLHSFFDKIGSHPKINLLAGQHWNRLGVLSLTIGDLHHDLAVKMLNDRFGIQTRGGCSCAGTYGHYLLGIDHQKSDEIISKLEAGTCSMKPGWVRLSIHPTTTNDELEYVCDSLLKLADTYHDWKNDYVQLDGTFSHRLETAKHASALEDNWFTI